MGSPDGSSVWAGPARSGCGHCMLGKDSYLRMTLTHVCSGCCVQANASACRACVPLQSMPTLYIVIYHHHTMCSTAAPGFVQESGACAASAATVHHKSLSKRSLELLIRRIIFPKKMCPLQRFIAAKKRRAYALILYKVLNKSYDTLFYTKY